MTDIRLDQDERGPGPSPVTSVDSATLAPESTESTVPTLPPPTRPDQTPVLPADWTPGDGVQPGAGPDLDAGDQGPDGRPGDPVHPTPPRGRMARVIRGRPEDPAWVRPAFVALLVATGFLY